MNELTSIVELLSKGGVVTLLVAGVYAMIRGWLMLPRERDAYIKRITQLEAECDKWEAMSLRLLNVSDNATSTAKQAVEANPAPALTPLKVQT